MKDMELFNEKDMKAFNEKEIKELLDPEVDYHEETRKSLKVSSKLRKYTKPIGLGAEGLAKRIYGNNDKAYIDKTNELRAKFNYNYPPTERLKFNQNTGYDRQFPGRCPSIHKGSIIDKGE